MKKPARPRRRRKSLIQRDVELLRGWATNHTDLEFVVPCGPAHLTHLGRVIEFEQGTEHIEFGFIARSGMRVKLVPAYWHRSEITEFDGSLHVDGPKAYTEAFVLRAAVKIPTDNLDSVEMQLKSWVQQQREIGVHLETGSHQLFFLGRVVELPSKCFSFVQAGRVLQLVVCLDDFNIMSVTTENEKKRIEMFSTATRERISILDDSSPEAVLRHLRLLSPSVH